MKAAFVRSTLLVLILSMCWACGSGATGAPVNISPEQIKKHDAKKAKDG
jgi:hypothetical protein